LWPVSNLILAVVRMTRVKSREIALSVAGPHQDETDISSMRVGISDLLSLGPVYRQLCIRSVSWLRLGAVGPQLLKVKVRWIENLRNDRSTRDQTVLPGYSQPGSVRWGRNSYIT
jgi:hypothetical protein